VTYTRLECVNDDPDFFSIAAAWANPQIEAMLSVSKIATTLHREAITNEHK
jgi:hypothetical protein